MIVAVADDCILSPCGRCRELLVQVNRANFDAQVVSRRRPHRLASRTAPRALVRRVNSFDLPKNLPPNRILHLLKGENSINRCACERFWYD